MHIQPHCNKHNQTILTDTQHKASHLKWCGCIYNTYLYTYYLKIWKWKFLGTQGTHRFSFMNNCTHSNSQDFLWFILVVLQRNSWHTMSLEFRFLPQPVGNLTLQHKKCGGHWEQSGCYAYYLPFTPLAHFHFPYNASYCVSCYFLRSGMSSSTLKSIFQKAVED